MFPFLSSLYNLNCTEAVGVLSRHKLKRKNSHSSEVASVNSLERLSYHSLNTLKVGSFSSPVSGRPRTILLSCKDDKWVSLSTISESSITDVHNLSSWNVGCLRSNLRSKLVDNSSVSKGSSCHDLIITSPCSVCVEVWLLDSLLKKISGGG